MDFLVAAAGFAAAFLLTAGVNRLGLAGWRKAGGEHWTERARRLWPVRKTHAVLLIYVPALLAMAASRAWHTPFAAVWIAAFLGAMGGGWVIARAVHPDVRPAVWLRHTVAIGALQLALWILLGAIAFLMPDNFGPRTWLMFAGAAALCTVWSFVLPPLLRLLGFIRPAGDRLQRIVARCAGDDARVKHVWQGRGPLANAFALPLNRSLLFLDPLLDALDDDEVSAICAHELGHLAESGLVVAGRVVAGFSLLPLVLIRPAFALAEFGGVALVFVAVWGWSRLARLLSHRLELRADAAAHQNQAAEGVYARALEKIHEINAIPAVLPGNNATHPHLYDRMLDAGVTPAFDRPAAPEKMTALGWILVVAGPALLMFLIMDGKSRRRPHHPPPAAEHSSLLNPED